MNNNIDYDTEAFKTWRKNKFPKPEKRKVQQLKGIAEGLREIKEAKRGGKQLMDLEDALQKLGGNAN